MSGQRLQKLAYVIRSGCLRDYLAAHANQSYVRAMNRYGSSTRVHCTGCGWRGGYFEPVGGVTTPYRPNARCPQCGCAERHRALLGYLRENDLIRPGQSCLEVGPSTVLANYVTGVGGRYVSIDLGTLPATARMDVTRLGFRTSAFDLVICSHVLEYVSDWRSGVRELYRVSKANGCVILTENFTPDANLAYCFARNSVPAGAPLRRFGPELGSMLIEAGFEVVPWDYTGQGGARGDWFFLCRPATKSMSAVEATALAQA